MYIFLPDALLYPSAGTCGTMRRACTKTVWEMSTTTRTPGRALRAASVIIVVTHLRESQATGATRPCGPPNLKTWWIWRTLNVSVMKTLKTLSNSYYQLFSIFAFAL